MRKLQSGPKGEFCSSPNDYEDGLTTRVDVSRCKHGSHFFNLAPSPQGFSPLVFFCG
jgi:hypothetical protein